MRVLYALVLTVSVAACGDSGARGSETDAPRDDGSPPAGAGTDAASAGGAAASATAAPPAGNVPVVLSAALGGKSYKADGTADCTYTDDASIYNVPAKMWRVQYNGGSGIQYLNLTVWRTGDPPDQLSFAVQSASADYRIATVKGGETVGRGTVTVQQEDNGGRFEIDGEAADGTKIRATIECQRFTEPVAEGG